MRSRPLDVLGTSSVKVLGPRWARSRTAASRAGVAAVRLATTRTRAGWAEDSMRNSFRGALRPVRPSLRRRRAPDEARARRPDEHAGPHPRVVHNRAPWRNLRTGGRASGDHLPLTLARPREAGRGR